MTKKAYDYILMISGVICGYVMIKSFFFIQTRPVRTDVIQGILVGFGLALVTAQITGKLKATKVNGWTTSVDGTGHDLSGEHNYIMSFPAGGLPQNNAFWSLTMGDAKNRFVENSINRYSVSDRSGLVPNADGSVDIYIQNTAPAGRESNWLPAPSGKFILWLRVYMPGETVLDGKYNVPPIVEVK